MRFLRILFVAFNRGVAKRRFSLRLFKPFPSTWSTIIPSGADKITLCIKTMRSFCVPLAWTCLAAYEGEAAALILTHPLEGGDKIVIIIVNDRNHALRKWYFFHANAPQNRPARAGVKTYG